MAKSVWKIEFLMKFQRSGRYKHYLAAIAAAIYGATTVSQYRNTTANCVAPRDRYTMLRRYSGCYDRY